MSGAGAITAKVKFSSRINTWPRPHGILFRHRLTVTAIPLLRPTGAPQERAPKRDRAPLVRDIGFGGLITNKAFAANRIIAELNELGARVIGSQLLRRQGGSPLPVCAPADECGLTNSDVAYS